MAKANIGKMDGLHDLLADYFIEQLQSGEELSGGTVAAINAFLKNNNITSDVVESNPMQNLQVKITDIIKKSKEGV